MRRAGRRVGHACSSSSQKAERVVLASSQGASREEIGADGYDTNQDDEQAQRERHPAKPATRRSGDERNFAE